VIASDRVGAARDLIAPVNPKFIYGCRDIDALAGILRECCAHPGELKRLREAVVRHMYTWSPAQNIAATVQAIRTAVNRIADDAQQGGDAPSASPNAPAASSKLHE
jgi:hypothetical protein